MRIIIGPKFDMLVKLDNDYEDLIFTEELVEHEAERSLKKSKNLMCISLPVQAKDRRFILDSGSGHDLISARKAERMNLKKRTCDPIMFHTANGSTATQTEAEIDLGAFDMTSQAYVLDDTPSVMSLGKRCMEEGYSFVWPSGKMPFMITKNGERIDLTIHDNIPYIDLGTYECTPYECCQTSKIHELLGHPQDGFDNFDDIDEIGRPSRRVHLDGESGLEMSNEDQNDFQHVKKLKKKKKKKGRAANRRKRMASPGEEALPEDGEYEPGTPYDGPPPGDETDFKDEGHGAPEDAAEGDEDDIEIDVVEGESRVAKRGTLKREANSLNHKLTHRYKNPYCDSCIRAKMKHFKTRRGAYKRELKKFGDLVTFDAVDTSKVHDDVLVLEKEVLVVRDCFTGIIGAYPSDRMTKDDVVTAVKQFIGAKKVRQAYSDHAPQFIEAMNEMKIPIDHSLPGRPQTNSIAERTNQFILTATSTCLLEAGLPPCFWRTAILCVCHLLNVEPNDDELSAWCKLHGSDFAGKLVPYGARVNYKPPKTRDAGQLHKFGPDSIPGVFAGYHIGPGMHWSRQYKVWPLSEFVHQNLGDDASKPEHRLLKPHLTEKVEMVTPLTFPCKKEYERINTTLEGMKEKETDRIPEIGQGLRHLHGRRPSHHTHTFGTNLSWRQYLRRLTFHAALSFNILTEGQLDSHMLNENDYEWLKLYHYIITSTELDRCKGYPVTEVLAMLTLGVERTVEGSIRNKLKGLGNQIGQFIIGKPWIDNWDELGGQVRNNKSLILTDLTYQTRSSSKAVHDIEAGLNNMGVSFVKVYQLPYESLEKPEEFLLLAKNALNFLRTNLNRLPNIKVHIWISFAPLFKGQNRMLVHEDGYVAKLAEIISDISKSSPLPIFVNILKDARFLGSQSSIVSIAEEFAGILKSKGIMHSTNEKFWKQIFACGSEPFYWRQGEGKEVIWAILEKYLIRQKVFLHCAMDHNMIHDLNEECVHVKNTGFDIEAIKQCTDHPRVIPSVRTG